MHNDTKFMFHVDSKMQDGVQDPYTMLKEVATRFDKKAYDLSRRLL